MLVGVKYLRVKCLPTTHVYEGSHKDGCYNQFHSSETRTYLYDIKVFMSSLVRYYLYCPNPLLLGPLTSGRGWILDSEWTIWKVGVYDRRRYRWVQRTLWQGSQYFYCTVYMNPSRCVMYEKEPLNESYNPRSCTMTVLWTKSQTGPYRVWLILCEKSLRLKIKIHLIVCNLIYEWTQFSGKWFSVYRESSLLSCSQ